MSKISPNSSKDLNALLENANDNTLAFLSILRRADFFLGDPANPLPSHIWAIATLDDLSIQVEKDPRSHSLHLRVYGKDKTDQTTEVRIAEWKISRLDLPS